MLIITAVHRVQFSVICAGSYQNVKRKINADWVFNLFEQFGNVHPTVMGFMCSAKGFFDSEVFVLFTFALFEKDSGMLPEITGNCL